MNLSYDVVVVGGGLAGACAALHLSRTRDVLLIEAGRRSGAVPAGLVNPLMSQRARPVWRMEEALEALHATLELADAAPLFDGRGVLRPAPDERQATFFREATQRCPEHAEWIGRSEAQRLYPDLSTPYGALFVRSGGALPNAAMVDRLVEAVERRAGVEAGATVHAWGESEEGAWVEFASEGRTERATARHVVLALGGGWDRHPELRALSLHSVKGQTVRVRLDGLPARLPHLAGAGYVAIGSDSLTIGSSYEHAFADLKPSPEQTREILRKASGMWPALREAQVLDAYAGVRVTVPGTRLPMLGPLPGRSRIWIFTGLGSKGLLMAPLLARELPAYLARPETVPAEVRVRRAA